MDINLPTSSEGENNKQIDGDKSPNIQDERVMQGDCTSGKNNNMVRTSV